MSEEYKAFRLAAEIDWNYKDSIESHYEALHYFVDNFYAKHRNSKVFIDKMDLNTKLDLFGSKGKICSVIETTLTAETPLTTVMTEQFRYYLLFNRNYYPGRPLDKFERTTDSMAGPWQTVHSKVVDAAALDNMVGQYRGHCAIVIVMQDKTIWFIHPNRMKQFVFEYETEDIPRGEIEKEGHIPANGRERFEEMISHRDPFPCSALPNATKPW